MAQTEAVIFDLFETLITEYAHGSRKVSRKSRNFHNLIGLSNSEFQQQWNERQVMRMNGGFPTYRAVMMDILEKNDLPFDELIIENLYQERIREKKVPFVDMDKDVISLLKLLKSEHVKLGLISNCTEEEVQGWSDCPLGDYFDAVVFSYQVGYAKPDAAIYELACSRLGVDPKHCMFVGDGGSNELAGARSVGMDVYQAAWYVPDSISCKITGFPKLKKPIELYERFQARQ
ncbi:putative hydrolase of the HAD superfamily [Paenibacillus sp. 1_12]|uniref:HAD family hydrolase n=1 Tax=Paenibacillus sp. 1_12 TaxID=1566278 RepID=UPI0008E4FBE7|nr:HAD family hydrolase [Paenibacillus sp. 1_12]SFL34507.1 putative hydrolase of the HAD superfamily [Paenibacillus sp. 1_12]